jgi:hypothetical protein
VQGHLSTATQHAKSVDEQKGITSKGWEYYSKALSSPFGQKVRTFYTTTSKQVLDIHEEAKRISTSSTPSAPGSTGDPAATPAIATSPTAPGGTTVPSQGAIPTTQAAPTVV